MEFVEGLCNEVCKLNLDVKDEITKVIRLGKKQTDGDTRFNKIAIPNNNSRWQVDKEAIGLSRVQQFSHLCVAHPYQISVNSIFKHIHTTSINTIIWHFVPFVYHPL